jgi:lysophospholipase L1-like esterase
MKTPVIALLFCGLALSPVRADPAPAGAAPAKPAAPEWAQLSKYREADRKLPAPANGEHRVVFMGDSITEFWSKKDPEFFAEKPYINRGISGQTTAQMLVRFRQDVLALNPEVVVILGGVNDIAENNGPTTLEAIEANLQSMVELAELHHVRVVLSSVLPAKAFPWHPGILPAAKVAELNAWIAAYCQRSGIVFLDYFPALSDGARGMFGPFSDDGIHPNGSGYAVMDPLAEKAIAAALRLPRP